MFDGTYKIDPHQDPQAKWQKILDKQKPRVPAPVEEDTIIGGISKLRDKIQALEPRLQDYFGNKEWSDFFVSHYSHLGDAKKSAGKALIEDLEMHALAQALSACDRGQEVMTLSKKDKALFAEGRDLAYPPGAQLSIAIRHLKEVSELFAETLLENSEIRQKYGFALRMELRDCCDSISTLCISMDGFLHDKTHVKGASALTNPISSDEWDRSF